VLLAAVVAALATVAGAPPAGAVPVDGQFTGPITNLDNNSSTSATVVLATSAPDRNPVSATVTLGSGLTVDCFGSQAVPAGAITFTGTGGTPSAAPSGARTLLLAGSTMAAGFTIPISITASISSSRTGLSGLATLDLPLTCADATLRFTTVANAPYALRTGHDGRPDVNGVDITHVIDREPVGTPAPWERCMYLWATPPAGTATPSSASWSIEGPAPAGAHIRSGWASGDPGGAGPSPGPKTPLRTMVCITDTTPTDTTFTVAFTPEGASVQGRLLLWVGEFVSFTGRAQGDVHNTTFDELHYDFQGVGEYVDAVHDSGKELAVQSRLEAVPNAPVTVTTAVAAQVNGDRVAAYLDPSSGSVDWYLDGSPLSVPANLPAGGAITQPDADHWRVEWADNGQGPGVTTGTSMQVSLGRWAPKDHLNIDEIVLGPGLHDTTDVAGLLGSPDRDGSNDLTPSWGGVPVSPDIDASTPPHTQPLYKEFGQSWLVTQPGSGSRRASLFDYLDPGHPGPGSYTHEHYPAATPRVVERDARSICERAGVTAFPQIDFCTYDVGVTGAREIADYYRDGWHPVN
jgi:hypothetical protein